MLSLPRSLRIELKEPFGPVYTDAQQLLHEANEPIVAVGDVVTHHLLETDHVPTLAFVDERTKREGVDDAVRVTIDGFDHEVAVDNPQATLTTDLLDALCEGLAGDGTTLVRVDGEEDLAALPAVLAVPEGASVVYGQPDEGMVLVTADVETKDLVGGLLERMDGDVGEVLDVRCI